MNATKSAYVNDIHRLARVHSEGANFDKLAARLEQKKIKQNSAVHRELVNNALILNA